jgi:hypothetical protein
MPERYRADPDLDPDPVVRLVAPEPTRIESSDPIAP